MPQTRILKLTGPLVISFWLRSAFAWVDTIFASVLHDAQGQALGDASIAAIGLTLPFMFVQTAVWVGTSNGLTARLAAAMGAGESGKIEQLKRAGIHLIWGLNGLFALFAVAVWFLSPHVGLPSLVAQQFQIYATVMVAGAALTSFWSILPDSLVKAHHDTRGTMWAGLFSATANVILNAVFVFVFGWGIFGIAFSTVIGRLAGLFFALLRARGHERLRIAAESAQATLATGSAAFAKPVAAILVLAGPSMMTYLLMAVESLAINGILANESESVSLLAAWSLFDRAVRFLSMPLIAAGVAMLPLAARLSGEKNWHALHEELRTLWRAGGLYLIAFVTPLAVLLSPHLARWLTDEPATFEHVNQALRLIPIGVAALLPYLVSRSAFEGIQLPRPALWVALLRAFVLVVPLSWLGLRFHQEIGYAPMQGVCAGFALGTFAAGVLLNRMLRKQLRQRMTAA
ncbi:MAG: MATE family efflux transporter [Planctomycetes bacterium]|nr:MATE family efflux transporter [Planctomycetota bacterium]MBT4029524.1 MATE family efflux transporter [Planctomycetota bacterium]MBT4560606.1 MATE family efflux transporter [Planctomycetota bacterium]MBT7013263.1 MATE family efflux transporter [Planctomycetota bacterium]MBT7317670.1 MATE family efflux transporter [Planctomycetota bacterium]